MNIAFVIRSAAHFSYHRTTLEHLVKRGHSVVLHVGSSESDGSPVGERALEEWLNRGHRVVITDTVRRDDRWRNLLRVCREARSYASYCRRGPACEFYRRRWQIYLPDWLRSFSDTAAGAAVLRRPEVHKALSAVERIAPPSARIVDALRRERPDCVVVSPANMRYDEELDYVKAARALGIPTVVPVLSWDNLTTKGLIHVAPDVLLAWNIDHHREAGLYHGVPAKRVVITGAPLFDKWFDTSAPRRSRESICHTVGLNPKKRYLLYLGSSGNVAKDEAWLVIRLAKTLRKSDNPALRDLEIVFKPHPANTEAVRSLDRAGIPVWPRENGMPDTAMAASQFRALMQHAVCTVGINTTGLLDAVVCDVPTIAVVTDEYKSTQSDAEHFQRIARSKAVYLTESANGAVKLVGQILAGRDPRACQRRRFTEEFIRPRGLNIDAGEAAARAIEKAAAGKPAKQIVAELRAELAEANAQAAAAAAAPDGTRPAAPRRGPDGEDRRAALFADRLELRDRRESAILTRAPRFDPAAAQRRARAAAEYFRRHFALERVPVVIGVPLHNNAKYLAEALDTLLAQDFRNFALFLLDDASSDGTAKIAERISARDPRVVFERSDRRLGMVQAWSETFRRARERFPSASYFAWASDHDLWDERWLSSLHAVMERHPDVVLAYPRTRKMHADGSPFHYVEPTRFDTFGLDDFRARWAHMCRSMIGAGNMVYGLMRISALARTGVYRRVVFPDRLLMTELAVEGQFCQVPEVLWHRRQLAASSAGRQRRTLFGSDVPRSAYAPPLLVHGVHIARAVRSARRGSAIKGSPIGSALMYIRGETGRKWRKLRLRRGARPTRKSAVQHQLATLEAKVAKLERRFTALARGEATPAAGRGNAAPGVRDAKRPRSTAADRHAAPATAPEQNMEPFSHRIRKAIGGAAESAVFAHYQHVRDRVLQMMDEDPDYKFSSYWAEEAAGFDYMFDASPLVIAKLREHTYHITGLKSYEYRSHHAAAAAPFASKLARLREEDVSGLFVPEAPELGGFGHTVDGAMVNMDTLKFYEALIALDRAGVLGRLRGTRRPVVLEIGAGWGGFAYQLRQLLPDVTYIIIDLPPTMLFSGTYLRATFPDARMRFYGDADVEDLLDNLEDADFVFLPPYAVPRVTLPPADLAVNIASFQEMTTAQVCGYVRALADAGCRTLYSLNRDRSKWNTELTSVTDIIASRYCIQRIPILNVPYTVLDWKANGATEPSPVDYRHLVGRL